MLLFVDYEHEDRYRDGSGEKIQAARTWITYRLEDLSRLPCMLVRYDRITPELLDRLQPRAIFISGNGTPPDRYDPASLKPLHDIVGTAGLPVFGFCGGFQLLSEALGSKVVPIDIAPDAPESDSLKKAPSGQHFEFGYHPIELVADHAVLEGLGPAPVFRHAHGLHVPQVPDGFQVLAKTDITPVQLAVSDDRKIVGTQFHPEYWTDEHPAGETLIANFLHWANV